MRHLFYSFLLCCLCGQLSAQTVHYVKATAPAGGAGTSWAVAFSQLADALSIANPGDQIWVAAGTYKPTGTTVTATFGLQPGVKLYGGFVGTETLLSQRNPAANITTLSGDLLGDDVVNDFTQKRTDNTRHVITVVSNGNPNDIAVVDGVTISGGQTSVVTADPANDRRGAGILTQAKLTVRNCIFKDSHGSTGVSVAAIGATASGLLIDKCTVQNTESTSQCAGIFMGALSSGTVKNSTFKDNKSLRGCVYPNVCTGIVVDSCLFENNTAGVDNFGCAFFSWQSNFTLKNSTFKNNTSGNGAGLYCDNRSKGNFYTIENCVFDGNIATSYGGTSIFNFQTTYEVRNSTFKNNTAPSSGAAIYNSDTCIFLVKGCLFEGHQASYAPVAANYGIGCVGTYEDCSFLTNTATNGGGAVSNGFKADVGYKNCIFKGNTARFGGAIFTQNDTTRITIDGCTFEENGAITNAGAVLINNNIAATITNSVFKVNSADIGGALSADGDSALVVTRTTFIDNLATTQGAAVNLQTAKATFTNCLLAKNLNLGAGAGGAISCNASGGNTATLKMVNCTVAENVAVIGAGVAMFQDTTGIVAATLTLQNCLFRQTDYDNYGVEAGTPAVVSLGGNQSNDATLVDFLTATKDVNAINQDFVDIDNNSFDLVEGPAVNGGILAGAPIDDIQGYPRVGLPDRGCYEFEVSGVLQAGLKSLPLTLSPNPTVERAMLSLDNAWSGQAQLDVFTQNGTLVRSLNLAKVSGKWSYSLQVQDLPAGTYRVRLLANNTQYQALLIKQ